MAHPDRPAPYPGDHEDQKPGESGQPPRPASEPDGAEGSSKTSKTRTDPATGAPTAGRPDTAG